MIIRFFIIFFCVFSSPLSAGAKKTLCLNMIVKDEKDVITRCLASVKPYIDYWVIVDTGSQDGTQEIIKDFMKDVPGELHQRPWVDFAHNRNEALQLAKNKADYLFFMDADDELVAEPKFCMPELDKDTYYIFIRYGDTEYARPQIISTKLDWKWEGVLHEALYYSGPKTVANIYGIKNVVHTDGCRSKDPEKYKKDAKILEAALAKEPDNARYVFYLAQSYRDAGEYEPALKYYTRRASMGGWDEEVYYSLYQAACMRQGLGHPSKEVLQAYFAAYRFRPSRPEALYMLAKCYRESGLHSEGYEVAKLGLRMPKSQDILFLMDWTRESGILLEYSICAYWLERYDEAFLASSLLLKNPQLPDNFRQCVLRNMKFISQKLDEQNTQSKVHALAEAFQGN